MPALLLRPRPLLLLLLLFWRPAYAQPTSLWAAISQNASFSILSNCVRQADPAILALLNDTGGSQLQRPRALAGAIDGLLRDDAWRTSLAGRAVDVRGRFTMEAVSAKWELLFREAMIDR